jgi:hypothetical protein
MPKSNFIIPSERIINRIFLIRGKKVMLDKDLALLYAVKTKNLNKAVKRNIERFPEDFMFELSEDELKILRFQIGTSRWGGARYKPYAFTELGVAMLSTVLRSKQAILVNIEIMRTFTKIRELLASNQDMRLKIEDMERRYDKNFKMIFDTLRKMMDEEEKPKEIMGFCLKK